MSSYIVDSFSDVLSQDDVLELFGRLQSSAGSLAKAAELCHLERKTIYDWEKTGYVKLSTKRKVLGALLEHLSRATLGYITRRTYGRAQDALRIYLSTLYEQCVTESDPDKFLQGVAEFESALKQYRVLAQNLSKDELPQMLYELSRHAQTLGAKWTTSWAALLQEKPPEVSREDLDSYWTSAIIQSSLKQRVDFQYYLAECIAKPHARVLISFSTRDLRQKENLGSDMQQSTAATTEIRPELRYPAEWFPQTLEPAQQRVPEELAVS